MKKVAILAIMLLIATSLSLELKVPEKAIYNANVPVVVNITEQNIDSIKIYLDGDVVYSQALTTNIDSSHVVTYMPYAPETHPSVSLLLYNLSEGTHEIEAKLFREGSVYKSKSEKLEVYEPASVERLNEIEKELENTKSSISELSGRIENVKGSASELEKDIESLKSDVKALESDLEKSTSTLSELDKKIDSLSANIEVSRKEIGSLKSKNSELMKELQDVNQKYKNLLSSYNLLKAKVTTIEEQQRKASAGFATLSQSILAFVVLVIIAAVGYFLWKQRSGESETLFETETSEAASSEEPEETLNEVMSEPRHRGRWAYKGEEKEEEQEKNQTETKRFSLADLIKRS